MTGWEGWGRMRSVDGDVMAVKGRKLTVAARGCDNQVPIRCRGKGRLCQRARALKIEHVSTAVNELST